MSSVDNLTCHLCSKPFTDPRILPCLHSFCCQCINREAEKAGLQQSIQCPTCRRTIPTSVGGASTFPQNLHLEFEVEVADCMTKFVSNNETQCNFCANGCTNPAVVFCCSCHKFLCKGGQDSHSRVPALLNHRVVTMNAESAAQLPTLMQPIERFCSQPRHIKHELDYYCQTCDCFICQQCFVTLHKDHSISDLYSIADTHRGEMKEVLQGTQGATSMLIGAIGTKNRLIHQLEASKQLTELAIKSAFERLMEKLVERKNLLLSELENTALSKLAPLKAQREHLEKLQMDIDHYTKVTSHILQTNTDYEVVALGSLVPTEVKAAIKEVETASNAPNHPSYLKASLQADTLEKKVSTFGNVLDLSSTPGKCSFMSAVSKDGDYHITVETGGPYEYSALHVACQAMTDSPNEPMILKEVEEGDGTYTITLTPGFKGPHRLVITMDGQQVREGLDGKGTLGHPEQVIEVDQPYCVAVGKDGDIYVGSNNDCIYLYDQDGNTKATIGESGSDNGQFNTPADICINGDVMYVADLGNNRIQKLTTRGKFLHAFGGSGLGPGQFSGPAGIVMDSSGRLVISDRDNNRIQVFGQNGEWLQTIDGNGSGDSAFSGPCGLTLDNQGNIHVAAGGSNVIKVFSSEGVYVRTYGEASNPTGVAVDDEGYSLVSEGDGNCLSIFDPQGSKVRTIGNLSNPTGITLDARSNTIYVANFTDCNVQKYTV